MAVRVQPGQSKNRVAIEARGTQSVTLANIGSAGVADVWVNGVHWEIDGDTAGTVPIEVAQLLTAANIT
ncbi:MAG: hypothetical protein KKE08_20480 [Gammaproteobacteria bacterium]|nr:hypothetical protein [Gammaproteobacteria bacterium]